MKSTIKSLGLLAVALTVTFLGTSALAAQVQPPSPSSAWLLDEGSGPATADAFGAFNGTLTGVISWSSDTPFAYIGNNSVDFGGFDLDYINVGAAIPTGGSALPDFTISGWTKASTAVDWGLMGSWNTGGAGGSQGEKGDFMLRQIGAGNIQLIIGEASLLGGIKLFEPSLSVPDGQWSHVAMTATNDFSSVSIYVDGVGETGAPHFIGFGYDPLADTRLGGTGYVMDGLGDEFALWDSALSADNIEWLANHSLLEFTLSTTLGDFDGIDGVTLVDYGIMKANWLTAASPALNVLGEVTGDGIVDINDFRVFRQLFPGGASAFAEALAAASAVPEPSALILLLAAAPMSLLRSRSGRKKER